MFGAVFETVELLHGEVVGEPSDELRSNLEGSVAPMLFTPYWRP